MRKDLIVTAFISMFLLTGCGMKNIAIETELSDDTVVVKVKLSKGELNFYKSSGRFVPEFQLVDETGSKDDIYDEVKSRAYTYVEDAGVLRRLLRLNRDNRVIPEECEHVYGVDKDGKDVNFHIYANYDIASRYLLRFQYMTSDRLKTNWVYTQYDKLPESDEYYRYGDDNSKIGLIEFPIEYFYDSSYNLCIYSRFMKKKHRI